MDQTTYGLARRALSVRKQLQIVLLIALGAAGLWVAAGILAISVVGSIREISSAS